MDLPNLSRRSSERLHTSSDGQKFEVRAESLNANYLFKYFGKDAGDLTGGGLLNENNFHSRLARKLRILSDRVTIFVGFHHRQPRIRQ